jgi:hypothetical protein
VPHRRIDVAAGEPAPVLRSARARNARDHHDVLINLTQSVPPLFGRFERVAEIVLDDPALRAASRERWRFYKERGYPLAHHDLQHLHGETPVNPEQENTRRELLDELDSLSAALESAWQEIAPGEDPRIPVLSDVVEVQRGGASGRTLRRGGQGRADFRRRRGLSRRRAACPMAARDRSRTAHTPAGARQGPFLAPEDGAT